MRRRKSFRVESLVINGNTSIPTSVLESRLSLKDGSPYSPILVEGARNAIIQAYNDDGFLQTKVTNKSEPGSGRACIGLSLMLTKKSVR